MTMEMHRQRGESLSAAVPDDGFPVQCSVFSVQCSPQNVFSVQCSPPKVQRSAFTVQRSRGFSLIELIVVVSIIGILAAVAMTSVKYAVRKAREAALRDNLFTMRKAIDQFYGDKDRYPANLEELVPGYVRAIPKDPITQLPDWQLVMDDPMTPEGEMSADPDPEAMTEPGVVDIRSNATGSTLDGIPYADL